MIRLRPLHPEGSELIAPRLAGARMPWPSRLSAPTRGRWFWLALWILAAAVSFVALIPVLLDRGPPVDGYEVIHTVSGISFAACGLVTWRRRPASAVGVLLGPILEQIDAPLALTLVALLGELWIAGFATLILSFVTGGRLVS